jgi:hypothetical protein
MCEKSSPNTIFILILNKISDHIRVSISYLFNIGLEKKGATL